MASEAALMQARDFLRHANTATDDPRRTRIDLLQVANYVARQAGEDKELRDLVAAVRGFLASQNIARQDLEIAAGNGWPAMAAVPGPGSVFYAALRLGGHATLRNAAFTDNIEKVIGDSHALNARVRARLKRFDPDWASALTVVAAEMAAEPGEFRSRLVAAAKDLQQLVSGDELPTWDDFSEGVAGSSWPPMTLGICPVLGGKYNENPKDWETNLGIGATGGFAACAVGFGPAGTADYTKMWLCIAGVVIIILILAAVAA